MKTKLIRFRVFAVGDITSLVDQKIAYKIYEWRIFSGSSGTSIGFGNKTKTNKWKKQRHIACLPILSCD